MIQTNPAKQGWLKNMREVSAKQTVEQLAADVPNIFEAHSYVTRWQLLKQKAFKPEGKLSGKEFSNSRVSD